MSQNTSRASNGAPARDPGELLALEQPASCEADAVSEIVDRAIRQCRPEEPSQDALIHGAMLGVVRGTRATHMDAGQTARGAIAGVMRAIDGIPGCSALAAFTSAARALILETAALQGQLNATVRGVLNTACGDGARGLTQEQVMSVVAVAIVDVMAAKSSDWSASNGGSLTE